MEELDPKDRTYNFIPKAHTCLRHVAGTLPPSPYFSPRTSFTTAHSPPPPTLPTPYLSPTHLLLPSTHLPPHHCSHHHHCSPYCFYTPCLPMQQLSIHILISLHIFLSLHILLTGYESFVKERFERCLDLYLCPRKLKRRLNIDPETLVPRLPKPSELRPYPNQMCIQYLGRTITAFLWFFSCSST